ncbi:DUF1003 domain-containing protein [Chitinophaga sp. Cy-1792]|uniref:DUF1003 domain-containing protein n=1 Tax=Chitinophaga sp. Cy-1792 TaxID=2608339 RepID=UPI00141D9ECB|nr:DUF1003 domain-containing protein [Chitinophaga sp. Cy-1792]NIG51965.1 DUF1003 domain-containing protein [Chitinophaga sp. Cy-1792]
MNTFVSDISGKSFPETEKVSAKLIRPSLMQMIKSDHPRFNHKCHIALSELTHYRHRFYESLFSQEMGELTQVEREVLENLKNNKVLTDKLEEDAANVHLTLGDRLADKIAEFGGSWRFIILFMLFILVWMGMNVYFLLNKGFDPYPFILLNLILSCIAALQAPVIMMSQNRQEEKDRQRARNDYMINLKSELEVRILHEKIDHLIITQQQDMLELQQAQLELMNQIMTAIKNGNTSNNQKDTNIKSS